MNSIGLKSIISSLPLKQMLANTLFFLLIKIITDY